ncbi:MAG: serine hydroxymethyltransferase [bacterium]|nr:serine hydroxymethyltransferase [bacterium]MDZ4284932.1 serine hydroxymethyltransferase [Patescibacteria group bacterium]
MVDKQIKKLVKLEAARQIGVINLIASENYISDGVLTALASPFINKYAEGYPGARYYQGNSVVDEVEWLCIERALKLYKLSPQKWHVNVQSLSGAPANFALYYALVPLGEKIMGLALDSGGHLSHGHKVSLTGKLWSQVPYGVSRIDERLDYDEIRAIALRERPKMIVTGYTAYSRIIDFKKFRAIADECGALLHVDMSHFAGLVAGGVYPSPFRYADTVMTTTHKTLRGPRSAIIFVREEHAKKLDKTIFPGMYGGPHMNQIAAVAVCLFEATQPSFKRYAAQVVKNSKVLARSLQSLGWRIISGGTDTHLFLVDTWMEGKGIGGKEAAERLEAAEIIVNKNAIPFDTRPPTDPSGIRLGTAAETTRGKKKEDMIEIAERIDSCLKS